MAESGVADLMVGLQVQLCHMRSLIDLQSIKAGSFTSRHSSQPLASFMQEAEEMSTVFAKELDGQIECALSPGSPARCIFDGERVMQILQSTVNHALAKTSREERVSIQCWVDKGEESSKHRLCFSIGTRNGSSSTRESSGRRSKLAKKYAGMGDFDDNGISVSKHLCIQLGGEF